MTDAKIEVKTEIKFANQSKFSLISGRANLHLVADIAKHLNVKPVNVRLEDFGNTEIRIEINESIRGQHVYILQTGAFDDSRSINDYLIELFGLVDACRRSSAASITVLLPFFPYARSDKKDAPRVPIMSALVAQMLESLGVTRIVAMDLHAGQIQGVTHIPFDNLYGIGLIINYLQSTLFAGMSNDEMNKRFVLASPDNGGVKRVEAYANKLKMKYVIMHKQRDHSKSSVVLQSMLIGKDEDVVGKTVILIDDMVDTCGTMKVAAAELKEHGAKDVIIVATHGVFSRDAFDKINGSDMITQVIVTNTLPQEENVKKTKKLVAIDISMFIAKIIDCLYNGSSIEAVFAK
jgi:ribose-phosphate pyrophosphokinase